MIKMTLSQPEIKMKIAPAKVVYQGGGGGTNDHKCSSVSVQPGFVVVAGNVKLRRRSVFVELYQRAELNVSKRRSARDLLNPSRPSSAHPKTTTFTGMFTVGAEPMHCAVRLFAPVL